MFQQHDYYVKTALSYISYTVLYCTGQYVLATFIISFDSSELLLCNALVKLYAIIKRFYMLTVSLYNYHISIVKPVSMKSEASMILLRSLCHQGLVTLT